MFERIVLAVDGSDQARGPSRPPSTSPPSPGARSSSSTCTTWASSSRETVDLETHDEARLLTEAALEVVMRAGVSARSELRAARSADVAKEILHAAKGFGADSIVLGSRGLGDFAGLLLGSVAHRVIQLADCPVVVVRAAGATAAARDRDEGRTADRVRPTEAESRWRRDVWMTCASSLRLTDLGRLYDVKHALEARGIEAEVWGDWAGQAARGRPP